MSDEAPATAVGEIIQAPPLDESLRMIQSRDHPHTGELGWVVPDTMQAATGQYYFKLSNCQHGTAGCYVLEADLTKPQAEVAAGNATNATKAEDTVETQIDPYKYNTTTVDRLVEAFSKSYNITEACQFAGIDRATYYRWLEQVPEFEGIVEEAKAQPLKDAKNVIHTAIKTGDVATAKWMVERRDPDFKPKAEVDNTHELKETRRKLGDVLDERATDDFGKQPAATAGDPSGAEVPQNPTDIS